MRIVTHILQFSFLVKSSCPLIGNYLITRVFQGGRVTEILDSLVCFVLEEGAMQEENKDGSQKSGGQPAQNSYSKVDS